jgi:hypothetical protein
LATIWELTQLLTPAIGFTALGALQAFLFLQRWIGIILLICISSNAAGLDPSTIYFEGGDVATHLDPTDALLVDVIHTDKTFPSLGRNHVGLGFETNTGKSLDYF